MGNKKAARGRWRGRGLSWASWCRGNYRKKRERTCSWDGALGSTQGIGGSSWRTDSGPITKTWVMSERALPSLVSSMDSWTWTWLPQTCLASTLLSGHLVPRNLVFGNAAFCPSPFCNLKTKNKNKSLILLLLKPWRSSSFRHLALKRSISPSRFLYQSSCPITTVSFYDVRVY